MGKPLGEVNCALVAGVVRMAAGRWREQLATRAIDVRECAAQASVGAGLARLSSVSFCLCVSVLFSKCDWQQLYILYCKFNSL